LTSNFINISIDILINKISKDILEFVFGEKREMASQQQQQQRLNRELNERMQKEQLRLQTAGMVNALTDKCWVSCEGFGDFQKFSFFSPFFLLSQKSKCVPEITSSRLNDVQ
jgi:hypothetical protein